MPEMIDLYNNARQFIRTTERGTPIQTGENKISVHVWFINSEGNFLLQQRVASAKKFPNMWGQTGGGAQSGESSWDCCVRESIEELGISPDINKSIWIGTFKRPIDFVDVWLVYDNTQLSELVLQPTEVQSARWVSLDDISAMQKDGTFIPSITPGLDMIKNYLNMEKLFKQTT